MLENLLLIHVNFDKPDPVAARFRLIVCTALHTGCAAIADAVCVLRATRLSGYRCGRLGGGTSADFLL